MKGSIYVIFIFAAAIITASCNTNKTLRQDSVNAAIKEFVTTHDAPGSDTYKGTFDDSSINNIEPVDQYSATEAVAMAHLSYKNERISNFRIDLKLRFIFRKTLDNKWTMTAFENTSSYGGMYTKDNGHLNIMAQ